jgi:Fe-S cluster biosynthesis and repair protein YggX
MSMDIVCRRCGQTRPALTQAPLPGARGATILAQICAQCWLDWVEERTRLINHERLFPSDPEHRKVLYTKMAAFLKLDG